MDNPRVTRRGYYHDLSISPYRWEAPNGEVLVFPSAKKKDIFLRELEYRKEKWRIQAVKMGYLDRITVDTYNDIMTGITSGLYSDICGGG